MTGIFVTVRLGSCRLPQKALKEIRGVKIIEYLISRIKFVNADTDVYICTTDLPEDYVFDEIARKMNVGVFHGDVENIPKRHYKCAEAFGVDFIVCVECDDVFCSPEAVSEIISAHNEYPDKYDIIKTEDLPLGTNASGYKVSVLKKMLSENEGAKMETGWGEMLKNEEAFSILKIFHAGEMKDEARLTLDYDEDFKLFKTLIEALDMDRKYVPQEEIISYIKANPQIREINAHLNEQYFENYNKKRREEGHGIE